MHVIRMLLDPRANPKVLQGIHVPSYLEMPGVSQEAVQDGAGEKEVLASLLGLLPLQPRPISKWWKMDRRLGLSQLSWLQSVCTVYFTSEIHHPPNKSHLLSIQLLDSSQAFKVTWFHVNLLYSVYSIYTDWHNLGAVIKALCALTKWSICFVHSHHRF